MKFPRGLLAWAGFALAMAAWVCAALADDAAVLDSARKITDLPRDVASKGLAVKFAGVVVAALPRQQICFVHDGATTMRVDNATNTPALKDIVVVEGKTTVGFAPLVWAHGVTRIGRTNALPEAPFATREVLLLGTSEHQWRRLAGIVTAITPRQASTLLTVTVPGGIVHCQVQGEVQPSHITNWMHKQVILTGAITTRFNEARQLVGAQLIVPTADLVTPAAAAESQAESIGISGRVMESMARVMAMVKDLTNAPAGPAVTIAAELMRYGTSTKRVRVSGTVLYQSRPARIYCVDSSGPLRVNLRQAEDFAAGELIEAIGYPASVDARVWLNDAVVRRLGKGPLPPPIPVTSGQALRGTQDGLRVSLRGRVMGHDDAELSQSQREMMFVQDSAGLFRVRFKLGTGSRIRYPVGTVATFSGLCVVENLTLNGGTSVNVYPDSPEAVSDIQPPPFWDTQRLTVFAGVLVALLAGTTGWLIQQRRQFAIVRLSEEKLERAALLQTQINEFATSLSPLHSEDDILWEITRQCIAMLGFVDCVIYLHDESRQTLCQRAAYGPKNPQDRVILNPIEIPVGQGIVGAVAATGIAEIVTDTRLDSRYILDDARRRSEITVPIIAGNRVLGVIDSEHPQAGFFTEDHLAVLKSIASLTANKLVRAKAERRLLELNLDLERRIEERTAQLRATNEELRAKVEERDHADSVRQAVYQISEAVHAVHDLPSLYARIHSIVATLMPAENFYLALLDRETNVLSFPYHRDQIDPQPKPRVAGRGMSEYVLRTGRATLANLEDIRRLRDAGEYVQTGHPAAIWLGVPLASKGVTFGVMAVQDHERADAFGEHEKQLLSFVAGQIALAIERKRAEAELRASADRLRQSEERFSKAFRASPIILSIASLQDGRFIDVNEAFLSSLGRPRDEVIGRTSLELGIWQTAQERDDFVRTLRTEGSIRNRIFTLDNRGERRTLMLSAELIVIGSEPCVVSVSADITERQQAETELLRTLARERELNQLKSRFVATISHEFRTPLGIVLSSADILDRYFDRLAPEQRREHLEDIQDSALAMARQMENVLLFGRIEAGRLRCHPAPVDLAALCARIIQQTSTATENTCPIQLQHPTPLPPVLADEALIGHVITNLLSNAVKYSAKGSPVECRISLEEATVVLTVRDRGMGIPQRDLEHLFEPFQRGSNVGLVPGTGMGLTIVKRCVELHEGTIRIESQEQSGTAVTVRWRGVAPDAAAPPATQPA